MIFRPLRAVSVLACLGVAAAALSACTPSSTPSAPATPVTSTPAGTSGSVPATSGSVTPTTAPSTTAAPTKPVHVSLLENDGATFGVGMPIIAWFDVAPTDAHAFAAATTVTVNDKPMTGAWYFEETSHQLPDGKLAALEAHWRPQTYWPGHAKIHLNLPVKGLSAGPGLSYDDSLTLDISTGAANISTVDAVSHTMTVMSDGKLEGTYPVSLGYPDTPTARGIKVIMEKGLDIRMTGPGYNDPHVKFTQRLTYGGEYLHSAPWNCTGSPGCTGSRNNIGSASTSNGCTNLLPADAAKLYNFFIVGDVFNYPNANGPAMRLGDGYGDWNVNWQLWLTGGELKTT